MQQQWIVYCSSQFLCSSLLEFRFVRRFRRDFADTDWVRSPLVYWGLSTTKVLTLEYLPGIKISNVAAMRSAGIDTRLVAQRATEAYLIQLLQTSFLHSDPHPGNIGIDNAGKSQQAWEVSAPGF